jgi:hypothetical protein
VTFSGSCEIDGDRFTATLPTKRHTEGHATVFGIDDLKLKLEGTFAGKSASVWGREHVPCVQLAGTLTLREQSLPAQTATAPTFNRQASEIAEAHPLKRRNWHKPAVARGPFFGSPGTLTIPSIPTISGINIKPVPQSLGRGRAMC